MSQNVNNTELGKKKKGFRRSWLYVKDKGFLISLLVMQGVYWIKLVRLDPRTWERKDHLRFNLLALLFKSHCLNTMQFTS